MIQNCSGFALLCSVIGPENLRHLVNQNLIQSELGSSRFRAVKNGAQFGQIFSS